ncbi:hypothetical protein [Streptomyces sp. NPDC060027]|uniref:hypothetical protein n=1 Tax=Streptomyces sp. NPDC060027 TaxID=3347040 RepID=UPI00369B151F
MVTADAAHLPPDVIPGTGFDAIIVTVGTWDLPWIHALAEGGRLVAPLRLHQYTWAISFTQHDGALHSDEPLIVCGFVAMQEATHEPPTAALSLAPVSISPGTTAPRCPSTGSPPPSPANRALGRITSTSLRRPAFGRDLSHGPTAGTGAFRQGHCTGTSRVYSFTAAGPRPSVF